MDYNNFFNLPRGHYFGVSVGVVIVLAAWDFVWKAWGMWRAARNNQVWWFVAILIFNTVGILPILYLYVFSKKNPAQPVAPQS